MSPRLVLVYNARAGIVAGILDSIHKTVSPSTYPCSLCAATHGALTIDRRWQGWLRSLGMPVAAFHRDDFRAAYTAERDRPLPLIGRDDDGRLTVLLDAAVLARLTTVDALIAALAPRLQTEAP